MFHHVPSTFIPQIELNVSNLSRSITFYEKVIGLQLFEQRGERYASFTANGTDILLILHVPTDVKRKQRGRTGLYHFALLVPTRQALANVLCRLVAADQPIGSADHLVSEALYLSDPDGNGIEIYRDRTPERWVWREEEVVMATNPLDVRTLYNEGVVERTIDPETIVGHLHLHVSDLQRALSYYEALGFETVAAASGAYFLSSNRYHHHIAINIWQGEDVPAADEGTVGLQRAVITYPTPFALEEAVGRLRSIEASVLAVDHRYETVDPSGNRFTLVV